jgi:hypothetical protein
MKTSIISSSYHLRGSAFFGTHHCKYALKTYITSSSYHLQGSTLFGAVQLKIASFPQLLTIEPHIVRLGRAVQLTIAIFRQFLTIEPHFVRTCRIFVIAPPKERRDKRERECVCVRSAEARSEDVRSADARCKYVRCEDVRYADVRCEDVLSQLLCKQDPTPRRSRKNATVLSPLELSTDLQRCFVFRSLWGILTLDLKSCCF